MADEAKIRYDIEAAVKGADSIDALAASVQNAADLLEGDLQRGARAAAQSLEAIGSKNRALDSFAATARAVQQLDGQMQAASGRVEQLGTKLQQSEQAARTLAQAQHHAAQALGAAQSAMQAQREALKNLKQGSDAATRASAEHRASVKALQEGISQSAAHVRAQQQALSAATQETRQHAGAHKALAAEYQASVQQAQRLSQQLGAQRAAAQEARGQLQTLGLQTHSVAQQQKVLAQEAQRVRERVQQQAPAWNAAASAASRATQVQAAHQRSVREGLQEMNKSLQRVQKIAMVFMGGGFAGGIVRDLAHVADEFKNIEARVKLATGAGEQFDKSFAGVQRVALATNSALDETGTLFARLTRASQEGGMAAAAAQERALALTQTINQAVQLSGGSAESAKAAVTQLIQGLQSGVLRGEEFNSVMEQTPRLAQALAQGLQVTTGELRKMAGQGALTAETVMRALEKQSAAVQGEFAQLPQTVGRALQNLATQWTLYVGEVDKVVQSSAALARGIDLLAGNLDGIVSSLLAAGKAFAALKIASMAQGFGTWAQQALLAQRATQAGTAATSAHTTALAANSAALTGNGAFATAAAAAHTRAASAMQAGTLAAGAQAGAMGLLARAGGAVSGMLGGPVGMLALAVAFHGEIAKGIRAVVEWGMGFTAAGRQLKANEKALAEHQAAMQAQQRAMEEAAQAAQQLAARQREQLLASMDAGAGAQVLIEKFGQMREAGQEAGAALAELGKAFDVQSVQGIRDMSAALQVLAYDGALSAEQVKQAWRAALDGQDLQQFERQAREAFAAAGGEAQKTAALLETLMEEAVARAGLSLQTLAGEMGKASRSAINDAEAIAQSLTALEKRGVDSARVLGASLAKAIAAADTQKALDAISAKVGQLRDALGESIADGLLAQARAQGRKLAEQLDAITPGINSVREAFRALGIASRESLQETAREAKEAYGTIAQSGQASAEEVRQAFAKAAEAAIQAAGGIAPAWVKAQAALKGFAIEATAAGDALKDIGSKAQSSAEKVQSAMQRMGVSSKKELRDMAQQAKADFELIERSGQASAEEVAKAFETAANMAIKAAGGMAPEWVQAQAAAHGFVLEMDEAGRASLKTFEEAERAARHMRNAAEEGAEGFAQMGAAAEEAGRKVQEFTSMSRDAQGFAVNSEGKRITQFVWSTASVIDYLKQTGLEESVAREVAKEFKDEYGNTIKHAREKYAGKYGSLSTALNKRAQYYLHDDRGRQQALEIAEKDRQKQEQWQQENRQKIEKTKSPQERQKAPEADEKYEKYTKDDKSGKSAPKGANRIVNIHLGNASYPVPTTAAGEQSLQTLGRAFLQTLARQKKATGVE